MSGQLVPQPAPDSTPRPAPDTNNPQRPHARRIAIPRVERRGSPCATRSGKVASMSTLVLPGFANVHSHAFQRLLRGEVQHRDPDREDTFWTWREAMYSLANRMDLDAIEAAARLTYVEGLEGGYTAVGEFHYLHHAPDGSPWPDPTAAAQAHLRAARQAGIRLTLLHTVYVRGGFGKAATDGQR
ncbi:MAG: amidohydrolase family protein, partial [Deltaproteobacteria bacterium]|nr:amidohydrolase family protein [Deltaproteobacteria bacterium]